MPNVCELTLLDYDIHDATHTHDDFHYRLTFEICFHASSDSRAAFDIFLRSIGREIEGETSLSIERNAESNGIFLEVRLIKLMFHVASHTVVVLPSACHNSSATWKGDTNTRLTPPWSCIFVELIHPLQS